MDFLYFVTLVIIALASAVLGATVYKKIAVKRLGDAEALAKRIVDEARKEARAQKKEILLQGQDDPGVQGRKVF